MRSTVLSLVLGLEGLFCLVRGVSRLEDISQACAEKNVVWAYYLLDLSWGVLIITLFRLWYYLFRHTVLIRALARSTPMGRTVS